MGRRKGEVFIHASGEYVPQQIVDLGNTGCASVAITYHRHWHRVDPGEFALLVTFGGGYSAGAALLKKK